MRALLVAARSPRFSLSLPELVRTQGRKALGMPLGLLTVAALLPRDWELRVVDLNVRPLAEADWDWAEIVLVSGMLPQRQSLLEVVARAKARGKTTLAGGPYPTSLPQEVQEAGCDFVVRGEAEGLLERVLKDLEQGVSGGVYESEDPVDLSRSPLPRFDLLNIMDYLLGSVQTTRGCPYDCEFCDVVNLNGRRIRHKTKAQVLAELSELNRLGWRNEVFIADDNFIGDRKWALETALEIDRWLEAQGRPFYFWFQGSLDLAADKPLMDALTQANFAVVFVGVEAVDRAALEQAGKVTVLKSSPARDLKELNRNGLTVMASFVLGLDGESGPMAQGIVDLVEEGQVPHIQATVLRVLPGTRLWKRLREEGRLLPDQPVFRHDPEPFNYLPRRPMADILEDHRAIWSTLYDPARFLNRARDSFLSLRPTRRAQAKSGGQAPPVRAPGLHRRPPRYLFQDLKALARLFYRQGIRSSSRALFWRNFLAIRSRNPSRLVRYLSTCNLAPDMFEHRRIIEASLPGLLEKSRVRDRREEAG